MNFDWRIYKLYPADQRAAKKSLDDSISELKIDYSADMFASCVSGIQMKKQNFYTFVWLSLKLYYLIDY